MSMTSELIRFNPRRASRRGVGAAEVRIIQGDIEAVLWMTEKDIRANLNLFSDLPAEALQGLKDALAAYATPHKAFPPVNSPVESTP